MALAPGLLGGSTPGRGSGVSSTAAEELVTRWKGTGGVAAAGKNANGPGGKKVEKALSIVSVPLSHATTPSWRSRSGAPVLLRPPPAPFKARIKNSLQGDGYNSSRPASTLPKAAVPTGKSEVSRLASQERERAREWLRQAAANPDSRELRPQEEEQRQPSRGGGAQAPLPPPLPKKPSLGFQNGGTTPRANCAHGDGRPHSSGSRTGRLLESQWRAQGGEEGGAGGGQTGGGAGVSGQKKTTRQPSEAGTGCTGPGGSATSGVMSSWYSVSGAQSEVREANALVAESFLNVKCRNRPASTTAPGTEGGDTAGGRIKGPPGAHPSMTSSNNNAPLRQATTTPRPPPLPQPAVGSQRGDDGVCGFVPSQVFSSSSAAGSAAKSQEGKKGGFRRKKYEMKSTTSRDQKGELHHHHYHVVHVYHDADHPRGEKNEDSV